MAPSIWSFLELTSFCFCAVAEDWDEGKVPVNFEENLTTHYRDYLDKDGNVIPDREENLQAFIYFIDRILPSVNYEINKYGPLEKKNKKLSDCFTRSDEAYGYMMVRNYAQRWDRLMLAKESKKTDRLEGTYSALPQADVPLKPYQQPSSWFHARWTGSQDGNKSTGWDKAGIVEFGKCGQMISQLRMQELTGATLDDYIINHWKGTIKSKASRSRPTVVEAWAEDQIDAKWEEV